MLSDIEIARNTVIRNISEIASGLGLNEDNYELYGKYKAKISSVDTPRKGKLILVTAMTPTKQGDGKTTISIAHRLSSLKDCNYLMAIDNGELAEMGTAEELMERKGIYYKLWTLQNEQLRKVMEGE